MKKRIQPSSTLSNLKTLPCEVIHTNYGLRPMARRTPIIAGLIASLTAVAATCTPNASGITTGKLVNETVSGGRSCLLFVPTSYITRTSPAPLILSYHGGNRNASQQADLTYSRPPTSTRNQNLRQDRWQGVPDVTTNDTAFTSEILDALGLRLRLNSSHVFATGKRDGAGFRRIAVFAPMSGAFYAPDNTDDGAQCDPYTVVNTCNASRADISMIEFHGGNDTIIPY
ncbi:carbohydrate esterase family 1 protein [Parathielavia appendiculata]|uniref:feruloyl esterase n=1 Tax=Parathielavia appendiculata TaxID=2587402 RepID=A0AAN6U931_9PEZI|nr:carbohydrate esterase family 1 protein [Parathielavia appendiculata]